MIVLLLAVIVVLLVAMLYAHRKHQDALAALTKVYERLSAKLEVNRPGFSGGSNS